MHLTPNRLIEDDAARKVLLMGDYGVGKTAFGQRVCDAFTHGNLYAESSKAGSRDLRRYVNAYMGMR